MKKIIGTSLFTAVLILTCIAGYSSNFGNIVKMNFREQDGKIAVLVTGSEQLRYRVKEYASPPHVLVQFYNAKSVLPYNRFDVNKGNIDHITINELAVNGEISTFVSIHTAYPASFDFELTDDTTTFKIAFDQQVSPDQRPALPAGETAKTYQSDTGTSQSSTTSQPYGDMPPIIQVPGEGRQPTNQIPYGSVVNGNEVEIPYKIKEYDTSPYIVGPVILQDADISQTVRLLSEAAGGANIVVEAALVSSQAGTSSGGSGITVTLSHITLEDALDIITSSNNWTWRQYSDYYAIMSKASAMEGVESVKAGYVYEDTANHLKVLVIQPEHSYACNLISFLQSVIPDAGCDSSKNLLFLKGIDRDINRARELLRTLDVPQTKVTKRTTQVTKVIRLRYIQLNEDFQGELSSVIQNPYFGGLQIASGGINTLTFDPDTNSIVFVGDEVVYERFYKLLEQLDIPSRQTVVKVIPLRFATVADIKQMEEINQFINTTRSVGDQSSVAKLMFSDATNTLTFIGSQEDFERLSEIINNLDVEDRKYVTEVIKLKYVQAMDIQSSEMMVNIAKFPGFGFSTQDCEDCGTHLEYDLQTNSIIISSQQQFIDNIKNLIQSMDVNVFETYEFEAFRLKYAPVYRTSQILGSLMTTEADTLEYPGDGGFFSYPDEFPGSETYTAGGGGESYAQSNKWVISPNMADNTIYVLARPSLMELARKVLNEIDIPTDQLKLDVQVIELSRNDRTQYNLEYIAKDGKFAAGGNIGENYYFNNTQPADPTGNQDFMAGTFNEVQSEIIGASGGFLAYNTLTDHVAAFAASLDVLIEKINARIVANPSVMAPEGKMVTFDFAERHPYSISSFGQIEVRTARTGIVIEVIPHFKDDYIVLDLEINIAEIVGYTAQNYPIESARNIITEIKCENGVPFIIGGMIKSKDTLTRVSFPILSDLPLVGSLFRKKSNEVQEYEVVMVITPTVIDVK